MNKLAELEQNRAALGTQQAAIEDAAEQNDGGVLTDEQLAEWEKLDEQVKALTAEIDGIKASREAIRQAREQRAEFSKPTSPTGSTTGRIGQPRLAAENDPKRGFKSSQQFFLAVMQAAQGSRPDERLLGLGLRRSEMLTAGSDEAGTYSGPYGGFFVPEGFLSQFLTTPSEGDPIAGRTTIIPMATPTVTLPARTDKDHSTSVSGGLTVRRRMETESVTATRMEIEQVKLSSFALFGTSYATEELISDSAISFAALLQQGFADEFRAAILNERINGSGIGCMEGVTNSPAKIEVAAEDNQVADTIVYENIYKMFARCWQPGNAIWLANHNTIPQLVILNQSVGTAGVPVWMPSAVGGVPNTLFGLPVFFTEFCATLGDAGDIILCNWSQYLEATYQTPQSASSIHVRFENHEQTFKFFMRNDGRGWWRSALTPKNGDTLSPFVTLAERA